MKRNNGIYPVRWYCSILLISVASGLFALGQQANNTTAVEDCVVRFAEEVNVPAVESGRVIGVVAKQNDSVSAGHIIARQDDSALLLKRRAAMWQKTAATEELNDDVDLQYANALYAEALTQRDADKGVYQKGGGTLRTLRQSELAVERARLEIARAQKTQRLSKIQVELREAELEAIDDQIERLKIKSPIDGVVLNIDYRPGEWINEGETIATVARMDQLCIDAFLSASVLPADQAVGCKVTVFWVRQGKSYSLHGVVDSCDPQLLAGQRYRLHATIQNQQHAGAWTLVPGADVTMHIHLPGS